ncbi:MAG: hypothetical protein IKR12_02350 [Clostridia bacterium]|nr:hypothetical protein [Clostridia bacterium]
MVYIDYNNTGAADLNGMHLHANNITVSRNNESTNVKVFAGYEHRYQTGYYEYETVTYNRSFWYVASDLLYGDGDDWYGSHLAIVGYHSNGTPIYEIHPESGQYKTSIYFYPTQHWAGTVVGGVVV